VACRTQHPNHFWPNTVALTTSLSKTWMCGLVSNYQCAIFSARLAGMGSGGVPVVETTQNTVRPKFFPCSLSVQFLCVRTTLVKLSHRLRCPRSKAFPRTNPLVVLPRTNGKPFSTLTAVVSIGCMPTVLLVVVNLAFFGAIAPGEMVCIHFRAAATAFEWVNFAHTIYYRCQQHSEQVVVLQ
jgi:hypothetical protein